MQFKVEVNVGKTLDIDIEAEDYADAIAKGEAAARKMIAEEGMGDDLYYDVDAHEDDILEEPPLEDETEDEPADEDVEDEISDVPLFDDEEEED